jgi:class 3 adenylate cyclase
MDFERFVSAPELEGLPDIMSEYYAFLSDVVRKWGGMIEQAMGAYIRVSFGVIPERSDRRIDDAVSAALTLTGRDPSRHLTIDKLREHSLSLALGIASGVCLSGIFGDSNRLVRGMSLGAASETAHRLCEAAGSSEVLIDGQTYMEATESVPMLVSNATDRSKELDGWTVYAL